MRDVRFWILGLLSAALAASCGDDEGGGSGNGGTDTTAPTVSITSPATSNTAAYTLRGIVNDDTGIAGLSYAIDGSEPIDLPLALTFAVPLELPEGETDIRVVAVDTSGNEGEASITVAVGIVVVNDPPVANDAQLSTHEEEPLEIDLTGSDEEGAPLAFEVVDEPEHGLLTGDAPNLIYTPNEDYNGSDGFAFRVNDGEHDSNRGTIAIDVLPVNDPPVLSGPDDVLADEDSPLTVRYTIADPDNSDGEVGLVEVVAPQHGTLDLTAFPDVTYSPERDYSGTDSFSIAADDGEAQSNVIAVDVEIRPRNDAPVATDLTLVTREDTPISVTLTGTDVDDLASTLEVRLTELPATGRLSSPSGDPYDVADLRTPLFINRVIYMPDPDFAGTDSFSFDVYDGGEEGERGTGTVSLTVVEGTIIYVAEDGSDASSGVTPDEPLASLARAVSQADEVSGSAVPDVISVAAGRYCTSGVVINRSIVIQGAGMDAVVLDGSSTEADCPVVEALACDARLAAEWPINPVLETANTRLGITVEISDLTIANGTHLDGLGGGLACDASCELTAVRVRDSCGLAGGGVSAHAASESRVPVELTLTDSEVIDNVAESGGGIYGNGAVTVTGSFIRENLATTTDLGSAKDVPSAPGHGGGVFFEAGSLGLIDTDLASNVAEAYGGGLAAMDADSVLIQESTIQLNEAGCEEDGTASAAAIYAEAFANGSTFEIETSSITENCSTNGTSAVFLVGYDATLTDVDIADNEGRTLISLGLDLSGDGLPRPPEVSLQAVDITSNVSTDLSGLGGFEVAYADLTIADSTFNDNVGSHRFFDVTGHIGTSEFSGNRAWSGAGLHLVAVDLTLEEVLINDNLTTRHGAMFISTSEVTLALSEVRRNRNAADAELDPDPEDESQHEGGGIFVQGFSFLEVVDSWIGDNEAETGAGVAAIESQVRFYRSTLSGNDAVFSEAGLRGSGGAVSAIDSTVVLENATLAGNGADETGSALYSSSSSDVRLFFTTIYANTAEDAEGSAIHGPAALRGTAVGNNTPNDCALVAPYVTSLGYNLDSDSTCLCPGDGPCVIGGTDQTGVDPGLNEILADYGGPTPTLLPEDDSPLKDEGPSGDACLDAESSLLSIDQRGNARPTTSIDQCDIGAVELP